MNARDLFRMKMRGEVAVNIVNTNNRLLKEGLSEKEISHHITNVFAEEESMRLHRDYGHDEDGVDIYGDAVHAAVNTYKKYLRLVYICMIIFFNHK